MKLSFPHASPDFIKRNPDLFCNVSTGKASKLEPDFGDAPLVKEKVQRPVGERFLVRIVSVRKRLLDEDNLCEKYHVDLLRYSGIIPKDSPDSVRIEVSQRKAGKGEKEFTAIAVEGILEITKENL